MSRSELSIAKVVELRKNHELTDEMVRDFWYDWFCKDSSLVRKGNTLLQRLSKIVKVNNGKFDPEKTYTFFKNNCPCCGSLYDDFRICDMETGEVIWTIIPSSGHRSSYGRAELWGSVNDFKEPVLEDVTWDDIVEYFKN